MRSSAAFTLVELMIVVAIIGVLSVVAGTAYRKYSDAGRTAEVYAVFGEFRNKQEAYRAEYSTYCNTRVGGTTCDGTTSGADETNDLYPALLSSGEPLAKDVSVVTSRPYGWQTLGVNPAKGNLYCGYVAVAGDANNWRTAGTRGRGLLGSTAPTTPWFYLNASCDNDGSAAQNAWFTTAMSTTVVAAVKEHN